MNQLAGGIMKRVGDRRIYKSCLYLKNKSFSYSIFAHVEKKLTCKSVCQEALVAILLVPDFIPALDDFLR